jgi:Double zinc ribbon
MSDSFNQRLRMIRFRRKKERTRFRDELKVIPRWLIWTCFSLYILAVIIGVSVNLLHIQNGGDVFPPELAHQPFLACLALTGVVTAVSACLSLWFFMMGYVYRDAKRRGMSPALWTVLVLILSPAYLFVGLIIYLLVREPLPYTCPQCSATVSARFNFCPNCKYNLHPACPKCQHEVSDTDKFCAYCGADVVPAVPVAGAPEAIALADGGANYPTRASQT